MLKKRRSGRPERSCHPASSAAALVCGYLELLIPLPVTVPGVKLGLGNIVILMALKRLGAKAGLFLMFIKVIASTLLFANPQMLVFSLAGGLLSWAIMALAVRSPCPSPYPALSWAWATS